MSHDPSVPNALPSGLAILQSNRPEDLRQLFLAHIGRFPLQPLEDEVVLVQSIGMGRWLELGMAANPSQDEHDGGLGISASVRYQLPARFLWQAYRSVLGPDRLPEHSLFDADRLRWLVFGLLDEVCERPGFEPLTRYLAVEKGEGYRRFQLADEIASLFEAYQFFRADWLLDWEVGNNVLRQDARRSVEVPPEQNWQPELWRTLLAAAGPAGQQHRGRLHSDFVAALETSEARFPALPRRVSVFGITTLPEQSLRALAALSRHVQVMVFVHNPCRYYWGNIIEARDLHRRWSRRHRPRPGMPDGVLDESEVADWANPLLASWGKLGRDFIGLLDRMDRPDRYRHWFDERIDVFSDHAKTTAAALLHQIQQSILDLEPSPAPGDRRGIPVEDDSLRFISAHSRQREVEILHDYLLEVFLPEDAPKPREVVVMVPNIDDYAPHIEAVFGQFAGLENHSAADRRYIPFSIGDRGGTGNSTFLRTVESLLGLPRWRLTGSEVLDLLHTPAVRDRFGMSPADLGLVERWLDGAGVRWGLDRMHRNELLDTEAAFGENSWSFGLDRMMLGYACGQRVQWSDVVAYDEVSAGDARLVASLRALLDRVRRWRLELQQPARPKEWEQRIRDLVESFMSSEDADDELDRYRLDQALASLTDAMTQAGLDEPLSLEIFSQALTEALEQDSAGSRFLVGSVNFCTLLPMRSLPFRVVCLLGMNDGEYPRSRSPVDFDLMEACSRAGDRSRRDDDRYLFLEALLSARDRFYASWVGRSVRDNAELPPSVLIGQLRDAIAAGWQLEARTPIEPTSPDPADPGQSLVEHLTIVHPLQPFSREYFRPGQNRLRTYAGEWGEVWTPAPANKFRPSSTEAPLPMEWPTDPLRLDTLAAFCKSPVGALMNQRLQARLARDSDIGGLPVDEPFELDSLQRWKLVDELLGRLATGDSSADHRETLEQHLRLLELEGRLPLGQQGRELAEELVEKALDIGKRYFAAVETFGGKVEPQPIQLAMTIRIGDQTGRIDLEDWLAPVHGCLDGEVGRIEVSASKLGGPRAPRWDKLAAVWPSHLAGCAVGLDLHTVLVGEDGDQRLPPLAPAAARSLLEDLVACWLIGQTRAVPAEPVSSGVYLKHRLQAQGLPDGQWLAGALQKAAEAYEGNDFQSGPLRRDPSLARIYPDFRRMLAGEEVDGFQTWSERIYGPMVRWVLDGGMAA